MYLPDKLAEVVTTDKKPDPRSIDGLIAWLETQDPARKYEPLSTTNCLLCQYVTFVRGKKSDWGDVFHMGLGGVDGKGFHGRGTIVYGSENCRSDKMRWEYTAGAALARAYAYKAECGL